MNESPPPELSLVSHATPALLRLLGIEHGAAWDIEAVRSRVCRAGLAVPIYKDIIAGRLTAPGSSELGAHLAQRWRRQRALDAVADALLADLLPRFAEQQIKVLALHGLALRLLFGGGYPCREMADIDILVAETEIPEVLRILGSLGWHSQLSATNMPALMQWGHHVSLVSDQSELPETELELHWRYTDVHHPYRLPEGDIWSGARSVVGERHTALCAPSPEWLLLQTAVHHYSHSYRRATRTAYDTFVISCWPQIDWKRILAMGRRYRCGLPLYITLQQARLWLQARVPDWVVKELRPRFVGRQIDRLIADPALPNGSALRLIGMPQLAALRSLATLAAPPASWVRYKYGVAESRSVIPAYLAHYWLQASRMARAASELLARSHGERP